VIASQGTNHRVVEAQRRMKARRYADAEGKMDGV